MFTDPSCRSSWQKRLSGMCRIISFQFCIMTLWVFNTRISITLSSEEKKVQSSNRNITDDLYSACQDSGFCSMLLQKAAAAASFVHLIWWGLEVGTKDHLCIFSVQSLLLPACSGYHCSLRKHAWTTEEARTALILPSTWVFSTPQC